MEAVNTRPTETEYTQSSDHCEMGSSLPAFLRPADLVYNGANEDKHVLQEDSNSRPLGLDISCKVNIYAMLISSLHKDRND